MSKVLVIDDDEDLVTIVSRRLSKAGFEVEAAYDTLQGTQFAHQIKPDAIVLDVNMPGGGGLLALKNLRLSAHTKRIPIVILTGTDDINLLDAIQMVGVDGLFKKPDGVQDMVEKIEALLNASPEPNV